MTRRLAILGGTLLLASCGGGLVDEGETAVVAEAALQTDLILKFVNGADATEAVLDDEVGLDSRAAKGIVAHVRGADGVLGTGDDDPCNDIAELDAIAYVGTSAITAIEKYAVAKYGGTTPTPNPDPTPAGASVTVESVTFTEAQVQGVLGLLNDRWEAEKWKIGLSSTAVTSLTTAARPFATIQQVAATPNVGTVALTKLRAYVDQAANPVTPVPDESGCVAKGGKYDTVAFTKDEECHAVEFLNKARFSEMGAIPDLARQVAYSYKATLADGTRTWTTVEQFANYDKIGTTSVAALKTAAAVWVVNGLPYDTVASVWTNRTKLLNGPVAFNHVFATKMVPNDDGYQCAEVRDTPTAPNYLSVCVPLYICEGAICFPDGVGAYVSADGKLRSGTGGYRLVANSLVHKTLVQ